MPTCDQCTIVTVGTGPTSLGTFTCLDDGMGNGPQSGNKYYYRLLANDVTGRTGGSCGIACTCTPSDSSCTNCANASMGSYFGCDVEMQP